MFLGVMLVDAVLFLDGLMWLLFQLRGFGCCSGLHRSSIAVEATQRCQQHDAENDEAPLQIIDG